MGKYILKRILMMVPTLLFVILFVFLILSATPSNPGRMILGPSASEQQVEAINREFGLHKSVPERFIDYIYNLIRGDMGKSFKSQQPVMSILLPKFPRTLQIAVWSVLISALIGIPLGILSAVKQYSLADSATTVFAMLFASVPSFWLGLMSMLLFSLILGWLPSSGVGTWKHLVMPVATLALPIAAYLSRITRTSMLETINQDYVRTAKSKGASTKRQIWVHTLRNALLPIISQIGMSFASLLGGALITEVVFGIPGFANEILTAIKIKDVPVVMGATIFLCVVFMVVMLIVDILYALIDPRIKAVYAE
ncbi:MAG: ABC transporter permease [Eubacteriales bacterium]|nr:ABC transporter permease [Eubacteriales bacterium]MDD4323913.1 ABC transporter permease [Eubacteriales bacterium]MDD4542114.1 ABC transporter permease [Eubacteriales bacterium]